MEHTDTKPLKDALAFFERLAAKIVEQGISLEECDEDIPTWERELAHEGALVLTLDVAHLVHKDPTIEVALDDHDGFNPTLFVTFRRDGAIYRIGIDKGYRHSDGETPLVGGEVFFERFFADSNERQITKVVMEDVLAAMVDVALKNHAEPEISENERATVTP